MKKRKVYEDDDGRTIADMSDISRPSTFVPHREKPQSQEKEDSFPFEKHEEPFTREERRMYVLAALKASLLIAAAFIAGLGVVVLLMVLAWG